MMLNEKHYLISLLSIHSFPLFAFTATHREWFLDHRVTFQFRCVSCLLRALSLSLCVRVCVYCMNQRLSQSFALESRVTENVSRFEKRLGLKTHQRTNERTNTRTAKFQAKEDYKLFTLKVFFPFSAIRY